MCQYQLDLDSYCMSSLHVSSCPAWPLSVYNIFRPSRVWGGTPCFKKVSNCASLFSDLTSKESAFQDLSQVLKEKDPASLCSSASPCSSPKRATFIGLVSFLRTLLWRTTLALRAKKEAPPSCKIGKLGFTCKLNLRVFSGLLLQRS